MARWGRGTWFTARASGLTKTPGPWGALALLCVALAGCGNDTDQSETAPAPAADEQATAAPDTTDLPTCEDRSRLVVFRINGVLTAGREQLGIWISDPAHVMEMRPGVLELATAYHDAGFHLIYSTRGNPDIDIHGVPYDDALMAWIEDQGFPTGERTELLQGSDRAALADRVSEAVIEGSGGGHAIYTNVPEDITGAQAAGFPAERIYGVDDAAEEEGAQEIPDDLSEHLTAVEDLDPFCHVD